MPWAQLIKVVKNADALDYILGAFERNYCEAEEKLGPLEDPEEPNLDFLSLSQKSLLAPDVKETFVVALWVPVSLGWVFKVADKIIDNTDHCFRSFPYIADVGDENDESEEHHARPGAQELVAVPFPHQSHKMNKDHEPIEPDEGVDASQHKIWNHLGHKISAIAVIFLKDGEAYHSKNNNAIHNHKYNFCRQNLASLPNFENSCVIYYVGQLANAHTLFEAHEEPHKTPFNYLKVDAQV